MIAKRYPLDDGNRGANIVECPICAKWRLSTDMREQENQSIGGGTRTSRVCRDTCWSPYHPQNDRGTKDTSERQPEYTRPPSETGDGVGTVPAALDIVWSPD